MLVLHLLLLLISCCLIDFVCGSFQDQVTSEQSWIQDVRRHLHQYPELLYEEQKTSEIIRSYLDEIGIPYKCACFLWNND